jgi:signal transduction histidine kinase
MQSPIFENSASSAQQRLGFWSVNLRTGAVVWDRETTLIHGKQPGYVPRLHEAITFFARADRARVVHEALAAYEAHRLFDIEVELAVDNGVHVRLIGGRGYDAHNDSPELHGIIETSPPSAHAAANEAQTGESVFFVAALLHELQGRVSSIAALAALSCDEPCDSQRAQDRFSRFAQSAAEMQRIINAVAQLRRGAPPRRERVDASAIAMSAWRSHVERNPAFARTQVTIEPGIELAGDPLELELAFDNLLGNALKFSATRAQAQVRVTASVHEGRVVVHVSDNGIGFARSDAGGIFNLFSRRCDPAIEGVGVGLAVVRRVVERHGGLIWAEGTPGQGATLSFYL